MVYRSYAVIFFLFTYCVLAIADVLDSPEFEGLFPNDEFPSIPPDPKAWEGVKGVAVAGRSTDLVERQGAVYVALAITLIAQKVWSAVSWAVGLFGLGASAYGLQKIVYRITIGLTALSLLLGWLLASSQQHTRIRSDGLATHAYWVDPTEEKRSSEAHIPLSHRSLKESSMATQNNGTWERHTTFYWDNEESHYLMYRKATVDDLGYENDGTFHHYRIQDSDHVKDLRKRMALGHPGIEKRLEERAYGVVTDYLWQNGNQDFYNLMHDSADFKDMTRKIDNYMEGNKQGVSCFTPIGSIGTHGGSSRFRVDNGIIAYGWNDKSYGFNGRAGNWAEGCKGTMSENF